MTREGRETVSATWKKPLKMTNRGAICECGSGYMPTIMEQSRNRWACRECYGLPVQWITHEGQS